MTIEPESNELTNDGVLRGIDHVRRGVAINAIPAGVYTPTRLRSIAETLRTAADMYESEARKCLCTAQIGIPDSIDRTQCPIHNVHEAYTLTDGRSKCACGYEPDDPASQRGSTLHSKELVAQHIAKMTNTIVHE